MTKEEFAEKHCKYCGTQRCPGVFADDPTWYEDCWEYREEVLGEKHKTVNEQILETMVSIKNKVD